MQCTAMTTTVYFALCVGMFILTTYTRANVINQDDDEFVRLSLLFFRKCAFL